ncbi:MULTISPECIES: branched-chain amino acid ABC transporter permease [Afipia]|jgi:branched-chain amino acid transport system permease protein|uniref:Branched-chain amino acid transport system permease protein n=1 Tax=Afipia massiliensis TaxID=211460 RepID=A0A840N470_9BRAD|nr:MULTISPECIES: branched-chain amino acid ABC transporter permease [Afipia]MBB5055219.1 branched-chain amino acid transport system permease protein [Afipia massiliensis]
MFDFPIQVLLGQVTIGLVNGCFYAILSLGLALIFGLLNIINFAHGALYMLGAFGVYLAMHKLGVNYWWSLVAVPIVVGVFGALVERYLLRRLAGLDHLYSLLLTFGLALVIESIFRDIYGSGGLPYPTPSELRGLIDLGFMRLPLYRIWIVGISLVVCLAIWLLIERTRLGSYLRAGTENARIVQALGINIPLMVTFVYALGAGLAAFAGVLAAPIYQVQPLMGSNILIVTFAVVVIGGLGSTAGAIITGLGLGLIEGLAKVVYPEVSSTIVFIVMMLVLLLRPAGLFGREA